MSTQNISSYTRDLEKNIINTSAASEGQIKFAIDTGRLFLSSGGHWHTYMTQSILGEYKLPGTSVTVPAPVVAHLDADDSTTILDKNYQTINDGDQISNWMCVTDGGDKHLTQKFSSRLPTYIENALGSKPGIRFKNSAKMHTSDQVAKPLHEGDFTAFTVIKLHYHGDPVTNNKDSEWQDYNPIWGGVGYCGSATISRQLGLNWRWNYQQGAIESVGGGRAAHSQGINNGDTMGPASTPTVVDAQNDVLIISQRWQGDNDPVSLKFQEMRIAGARRWKIQNTAQGTTSLVSGLEVGCGDFQSNDTINGEFDIGELIILQGSLDNNSMNSIGNHLSTKWGATWEDIT